jgi:putative redox protein
MAVDIDIVYTGDLHCEATHRPSGSKLVTDAPVDNGGKGEAFSPTDLCATSLGSCLVTTMALVAARHGIELKGTTVHVVKEMVADPTRRVGALRTTVTFPPGLGLGREDRSRLEAAARACPVKKSLAPLVEVPIAFVWPD